MGFSVTILNIKVVVTPYRMRVAKGIVVLRVWLALWL